MEKTLQEKVREAFAATGPVALEALVLEMAVRIVDLEAVLEAKTAPAAK